MTAPSRRHHVARSVHLRTHTSSLESFHTCCSATTVATPEFAAGDCTTKEALVSEVVGIDDKEERLKTCYVLEGLQLL